jgi:hypothetical protein
LVNTIPKSPGFRFSPSRDWKWHKVTGEADGKTKNKGRERDGRGLSEGGKRRKVTGEEDGKIKKRDGKVSEKNKLRTGGKFNHRKVTGEEDGKNKKEGKVPKNNK